MVDLHPNVPGGPRFPVQRALVGLALAVDTREARLGVLARALPALELRLARLLAWLREQDLAPLGYAGWLSFLRENVEWGQSWTRDLLRLVRSGLGDVVRAACEGRIALSLAAQAPGWCTREGQAEWLAQAVAGRLPPRPKARPRGSSALLATGEPDTLVVWHARRKARLLVGLPLSDREVDARILAWWRDGRDDLVQEAQAPAPRPASVPLDLAWDVDDPATALLGPWKTPTGLADAMAALRAIQEARRERVVELGRLYEAVVRQGAYKAWGYRTVDAFCRGAMGLCARTLQRYRELGRTLRRFPALEALPLAKVEALGRVVDDWDVDRWAAVAGRTGAGELKAATAHVAAGADAEVVLGAYEAAIAATTGTVALQGMQAPVPPPRTDRVHPDLPAAACWLVFEVDVPPQRGFGRVKERDDFVCANPECRRRALRNHAHHVQFRSRGGSDDLANGVCVCPSCHQRLVHPGHVAVTVEPTPNGPAHVWRYPGGRVATVFPGPDGIGMAAPARLAG